MVKQLLRNQQEGSCLISPHTPLLSCHVGKHVSRAPQCVQCVISFPSQYFLPMRKPSLPICPWLAGLGFGLPLVNPLALTETERNWLLV